MLRTTGYIFLTCVMLLQQLQMVVVCTIFLSQQEYLIKYSCVNRHNPHSKCWAHCQLSKRITEQEKNQQQSKILLKEESEFYVWFRRIWEFAFTIEDLKPDLSLYVVTKLSSGCSFENFQPPE